LCYSSDRDEFINGEYDGRSCENDDVNVFYAKCLVEQNEIDAQQTGEVCDVKKVSRYEVQPSSNKELQ
jgi:hypothetical protein